MTVNSNQIRVRVSTVDAPAPDVDSHERDWYVARCLAVEVTSQVECFGEALVNLREVFELYFETNRSPSRSKRRSSFPSTSLPCVQGVLVVGV